MAVLEGDVRDAVIPEPSPEVVLTLQGSPDLRGQTPGSDMDTEGRF